MLNELSLIKIVLSVLALSIASLQDWETREIDDEIWMILGFLGGTITTIELIILSSISLLQITLFSIAFSFIVGYLIYIGGLVGGADQKAIWALGVTFPYYPIYHLLSPLLSVNPIFMITVFENAILVALISIPYCWLRNVISFLRGERLFEYKLPAWKKIILLLTAIKIPFDKADWRKIYPLEKIDFSKIPPHIEVELFSTVDEEIEVESLKRGIEEGVLPDRIWISLGIPMVIFIFAGLIISLFLGDILLSILPKILGVLGIL